MAWTFSGLGQYILLGYGWCRNADGKFPRAYDKYGKKDRTWCADECTSYPQCVAHGYFNGHATNPTGVCLLYGNTLVRDTMVGRGWRPHAESYGTDNISTVSGSTQFACYQKKSGTHWSTVSSVLAFLCTQ